MNYLVKTFEVILGVILSSMLLDKINCEGKNLNTYLKINYEIKTSCTQGYLIATFSVDCRTKCVVECNSNPDCYFAELSQSVCKLYRKVALLYMNPSTSGNLYQKNNGSGFAFPNLIQSSTKCLMNYWPFSGNLDDVVGGANMIYGVNAGLTQDRFGNPNSSIQLNHGYYKVRPGVYFSGDFTISAWFKLNSIGFFNRLIDFGVVNLDNVYLSLTSYNNFKPYIGIFSGSYLITLSINQILNVNTWYHITVTLKGTFGSIFIDGQLKATGSLYIPRNVTRTKCFIGRSNWYPTDQDTNGAFDELMFFNGALSQSEINLLI